MHPLETRILGSIKKNDLISTADSVIVAVSGGPDSVALLCLLSKTLPDCRFTGVYVNHNLRPDESCKEKELVGNLCEKLGLVFEYVSIDVKDKSAKSRRSLEDCARHMRYRELEKIRQARNADLIAVGHTSDDQAEQFLIRMIRGSGLKGLGGMIARRGKIIRPLLGVKKSEILSYLEETTVNYCIDSSNYSRKFLRNQVRLDLLPLLEKDFNPSIKRTILNTMAVFQDEEDYLEAETSRYYQATVSKRKFTEGSATREECLALVEPLLVYHPALRRRIFEKMCWDSGCRPTFKMIDRIDSHAAQGRTGAKLHLPDNLKVIKTSDSIIFSVQNTHGPPLDDAENLFGPEININNAGIYAVSSLGIEISLKEGVPAQEPCAGALVVDADLVEYPLVLRPPRSGESFQPLGAPGRKKITRILSDRKIPRHLRYRFPVLVSQDKIIALVGLLINDDYKTRPETSRFLQICSSENPITIPVW